MAKQGKTFKTGSVRLMSAFMEYQREEVEDVRPCEDPIYVVTVARNVSEANAQHDAKVEALVASLRPGLGIFNWEDGDFLVEQVMYCEEEDWDGRSF